MIYHKPCCKARDFNRNPLNGFRNALISGWWMERLGHRFFIEGS